MSEAFIRKPLMSGHCASGGADLSNASHERCQKNGGFQRANPKREFQPCPCPCHYGTGPEAEAYGEAAEVYECGGCGYEIVEATFWPLDTDGDVRYTHIDGTGRATGEDCTSTRRVSRNEEPEAEPHEPDALDQQRADAIELQQEMAESEEDDDFIGLDPEPEETETEPEETEPEDEWDDLLSEFDLD